MILSQDRPVDITTKLCHITATATAAGSTTMAGPAWQSFLDGLQRVPVRSTGVDVGDAVCSCVHVRSVCAACRVVPIGLPICLAVEQKSIKGQLKQKAEYFIYEQYVGK